MQSEGLDQFEKQFNRLKSELQAEKDEKNSIKDELADIQAELLEKTESLNIAFENEMSGEKQLRTKSEKSCEELRTTMDCFIFLFHFVYLDFLLYVFNFIL